MENKGTSLERFCKNYTVNKDTQCWEWQGAKTGGMGYGCLRINKKTISTHRLSWELFIGEIPKGKSVLHKCDNPACVNPNHLFVGTQKDNVMDCIEKNRGNKKRVIGQRIKILNRIRH